jgi:YVTN family beta-propeller protein
MEGQLEGRVRIRVVTLLAVIGLAGSAWSPARAGGVDVYAYTGPAGLDPALADLSPRVYVPNEHGRSVSVIDATTLTVIKKIKVGSYPHHVTPSWTMRRLFVNNMNSSSLTVIDPWSVSKIGSRSVRAPYNLYFTPDGTTALDIAEPLNRIVFYTRQGWKKLGGLAIPTAGVDHGDFTVDGTHFLVTTEYGGWLYKVNIAQRRIVGSLRLGGRPIDVKLSADGTVFYVANQRFDGVSIVDPEAMTETDFLPTGNGAHGLAVSRDGDRLYVSNRRAGSISVIDFATRSVVATWSVGGSPDMLSVSIDGSQLWASNRWHDTVSVIDTSDGHVIKKIAVGNAPHGLTYFPQPGRFSIGHNGVYR